MPKTAHTSTCTKMMSDRFIECRGGRILLTLRRTLAGTLGIVFALSLASATPAHAQQFARPLGDDRLDALATRYFASIWRLDPPRATRAGVHDYDDRLGSYDAEAFGARLDNARRFLAELKGIDRSTMGAEGSYDAQILQAALERDVLTLGTLAPWKHRPSYYTNIASNAAYLLLARDFAPLPVRMRALLARERQMPSMLATGQANITTVDAVTAQIDRADIAGAIVFFTNVVPAALTSVKDSELQKQFANANASVIAGLRVYAASLDAGVFAHPSGTYAIGARNFAELLQLQELTPITLATYERVGEAALANTRAEFLATARRIDATKSPEAVVATLDAEHPAAGSLLGKAASDLLALRTFVQTHDIVTLPPDDDVKVIPTPEFARATTFASIDVPGALEIKATHAYYNVTPTDPSWSTTRQEQHLSFFNDSYFPLVSAHEVMPGHYVNFALDRHERLSLIRKLLGSTSFAEGWAHYVEQMMVDQGWGNGDPKVRLAQLQGALQRECRYLVGLREHTAGMTLEGATAFFETNAFLAPEPAHREALRGAVDPLYGYYTLGKLEILKLREDYKKVRGSSYKLETFHDDLLAHGDPPIAIVRKIILGADDDGKLL